MDMNNSTHNHWFLIAQTQEIGIYQVAVPEDWCLWSEWQTIHTTISHAPYLLLLIPYSTNTIKYLRPLWFFTTYTLFLDSFRQSVCVYLVFGVQILKQNFLGCILLFEPVGSRDIFLNLDDVYLHFIQLYNIHVYSG